MLRYSCAQSGIFFVALSSRTGWVWSILLSFCPALSGEQTSFYPANCQGRAGPPINLRNTEINQCRELNPGHLVGNLWLPTLLYSSSTVAYSLYGTTPDVTLDESKNKLELVLLLQLASWLCAQPSTRLPIESNLPNGNWSGITYRHCKSALMFQPNQKRWTRFAAKPKS